MNILQSTRSFVVNILHDGNDSIRLALDNEHEDFLYDDAGINKSGTVTSPMHLYDGVTDMLGSATVRIFDDDTEEWVTSTGQGASAAASISGATLRVTGIRANSVKVRVRAEYPISSGNYYYTEFTSNKTSQDKYDLVLNPNSVAYNPATYTAKSIAISGTRTDLQGNKYALAFGSGATNISSTSGSGTIRLYATYKDSSSGAAKTVQVTSTPFVITAGADGHAALNDGIYFELRKYAGDGTYKVCDYETIEIAKAENGQNGQNGRNGANSIRLDLDNEADIIACDSTGKVRFARTVTTHAKIYDGASAATSGVEMTGTTAQVQDALKIRNIAVSDAGASGAYIIPSVSLSGGILTVSWAFTTSHKVAQASIPLSIGLKYGSLSVAYTGTFTLTPMNATAIYQLLPSMNEIAFGVGSDNNFTPSSQPIDCGYTKYTGSGVTTVASEHSQFESSYRIACRFIDASGNPVVRPGSTSTNTDKWDWLVAALTVNAGDTYTAVEFALTTAFSIAAIGDENIIDRETIPVVKSGKRGPSTPAYTIVMNSFSSQFDMDTMRLTSSFSCHVVKTEGDSVTDPATTGKIQARIDNGSWHDLTTEQPGLYIDDGAFTDSSARQSVPAAINFRYVLDNQALATESFPISVKGRQGVTGRMYYMAGEFVVGSGREYDLTPSLCPVVYYKTTVNGNAVEWWYLTASKSYSTEADKPKDGSSKWTPLDNFGVVLTEAIFVKEFAQFGSAIITHDWLISLHGKINGTAYGGNDVEHPDKYPSGSGPAAYTYFEPLSPNGDRVFRLANNTSFNNTSYGDKCLYYYMDAASANIRIEGTVTGGTMTIGLFEGVGSNPVATATITGSNTSAVITYNAIKKDTYYTVKAKMSSNSYSGTITDIRQQPFAPNYAIDLLTGNSYQNGAYIKGEIRASKYYVARQSISVKNEGSTVTVDVNEGVQIVDVQSQSTDGLTPNQIRLPAASANEGMTIDVYVVRGILTVGYSPSPVTIISKGGEIYSGRTWYQQTGYPTLRIGEMVRIYSNGTSWVVLEDYNISAETISSVDVTATNAHVTRLDSGGATDGSAPVSLPCNINANDTVDLPASPKVGMVVLCLRCTTIRTLNSSIKIKDSGGNEHSNPWNTGNTKPRIMVYDGTYWREFYCG